MTLVFSLVPTSFGSIVIFNKTTKEAEQKLFVLKSINAFLALLTAVMVPTLMISRIDTSLMAYIMIVLGLSTYLSLTDFGIGKPVYALIKELHTHQNTDALKKLLTEVSSIYLKLVLISTLVSSSIFFIVGIQYEAQTVFSWQILVIFCLFNAVNPILSIYKPLLSAINRYNEFEKIDFFRRTLLLCFMLLICFSINTVFLYGLLLAGCFFLFFRALILLDVKPTMEFPVRDFFSKHKSSFYSAFIFSLCELFIYNCGYVLLPIFGSDTDVILYGFWMRAFLVMVMLLRIIIDVKMHSIVEIFFSFNSKVAYRKLFSLIYVTTSAYLLFSGVFYCLMPLLDELWFKEFSLNTDHFIFTVIFFGFLNIIIHAIGSLWLSIKVNYRFLRNSSVFAALGIGVSVLIASRMHITFFWPIITTYAIYFLAYLVVLNNSFSSNLVRNQY